MHTNTLTIPPFLPRSSASPRPASGEPRSLLRDLRLPRLPRDLRLVETLKARMPVADPALRLEKQLQKSAQRGRRVVLGTPQLPYDPLVLGGAPLAALEQFDGLDVVVTTGSAEIREQLDLLVELDRRHAVTVDLLTPIPNAGRTASCDPDFIDLRERLDAASTLASEGITVRLVVTGLPAAGDGTPSPAAAARVRRLFEAARTCRAFDVTAEGCGPEWGLLIQRLRLEHGFPDRLPGRG